MPPCDLRRNIIAALGDTLQSYLLEVSLHEPEACQRLREHTQTLSQAMMISSPEQVQMLLLLFKLQDTSKGIEIGTFTGCTSRRPNDSIFRWYPSAMA